MASLQGERDSFRTQLHGSVAELEDLRVQSKLQETVEASGVDELKLELESLRQVWQCHPAVCASTTWC